MLVAIFKAATPSNCGKPLKDSLPNQYSKEVGGQVNSLGYGKNVNHVKQWAIRSQAPIAPPNLEGGMGKVQRLNGGGFTVR